MAYSWQTEVAVSGQTDVLINIEYLERRDIVISIDGTIIDTYSWASDTKVILDTPLVGGEIIRVDRSTDTGRLRIKFSEGSPFIRINLDEQNQQFLFIAQEIVEGISVGGFYNNIDMNGYRIVNLGYPVDQSDAANKEYVDVSLQKVDKLIQDSQNAVQVATDAALFAKAAADEIRDIIGGVGTIVNSVNTMTGDVLLTAENLPYDEDKDDYDGGTVGKGIQNAVAEGVPIGMIVPFFSPTNIPLGYIPLNGQSFEQNTYPKLTSMLVSGVFPLALLHDWTADPLNRNKFAIEDLPDGSYRFYFPDLNNNLYGYSGGLFLRGSVNGAHEAIQDHAFQDHNHPVFAGGATAVALRSSAGFCGLTTKESQSSPLSDPDYWDTTQSAGIGGKPLVGATSILRKYNTAEETRPVNTGIIWCMKVFSPNNIEVGDADISQLMAKLNEMTTEFAEFRSRIEAPRKITLYPNGSEESPASSGISTRRLIENPFGTDFCIAYIEVFYNNIWTRPECWYSSGGYGTHCGYVEQTNMIVMQSGNVSVSYSNAALGMELHGSTATGAALNSLPFRIQVIRVNI